MRHWASRKPPSPGEAPLFSRSSGKGPVYGSKRPVRGRKRRTRSATVLGVALVVALYFTPTLFERFVLPAALPHHSVAKVPPPGYEAASSPLGLPPAPSGSTAYVLQKSPDPGQPVVAYDPCRAVHYVIRPDNAPPGTDRLIQGDRILSFPPPPDCSSCMTESRPKRHRRLAKHTSLSATASNGAHG